MKLLCYLIGCKFREYTFQTASLLICQRCGKAVL